MSDNKSIKSIELRDLSTSATSQVARDSSPAPLSANQSNQSNQSNQTSQSEPSTIKRETSSETSTNEDTSSSPGRWSKFCDQFRRAATVAGDVEAQSTTKLGDMKTRHVALIAAAGGLGTGLLVGNGQALTYGGPGGLLISYSVVGIMLFITMSSAGELAVRYSSMSGGFNAYAAKLVDPSLSFAVAWCYCIQWMTVLPLEMVTATMTVKYWNTSINPDVFVVIFLAFVFATSFFGAKGYAEVEFVLNILKVTMIIVFMICGIIQDTGNFGKSEYLGFKYFKDPGAFANGFKGVCSVFVTSAFSLGGTEFMALTAADQAQPRKAIPRAMKQVFYRLLIFYLGSILIVGMIVPYNSSQLMGSGSNNGAPASPYVIGVIQLADGLAHYINAIILLALLSVSNSALYCSSRTLFSLAQQGFAPKWFDFIDRKGRPIRAMGVSILISLFSFIAAYEKQEAVFTWLLSLSGLAALFTWATISISHLRFRKAMKVQGKSLKELGFVSSTGVWGTWFALAVNIFIFIVQFWVSLWPIGANGGVDVANFFQNYLGMVTFLILYIGHRIFTRNWTFMIPPSEVDLETDSHVFAEDIMKQEEEEDKEIHKTLAWYKKVGYFFC